jgi:hypothetical protein
MKQVKVLIIFIIAIAFVFPSLKCQTDESELDLINEANFLQEEVAKILGAEVTGEVKKGFKDKTELLLVLNKMLAEESLKEELYKDERILKFFGFIPKDMELEKTLKAFLFEQIAGFYDPKAKELYLIRKGRTSQLDSPMIQNGTLVHELCHAIQDMYIDLNFPADSKKTEDADLIVARNAFIEGQATVVMLQYLTDLPIENIPDIGLMRGLVESSGDLSGKNFKEFKNLPRYLKEHLAFFPYLEGASFYRKFLLANQNIKPIDALEMMPITSEQVLHFEKYQAKDYPKSVELLSYENFMGSEWNLLKKDILGEIDWRLLFSEMGDIKTAVNDAEGWDGTMFYLYEKKDNKSLSMILISTWDTSKDRDEAIENVKKILKKKYPKSTETKGKYEYGIKDGKNGSFILIKGNDFVLLENILLNNFEILAKNALKYWTIETQE